MKCLVEASIYELGMGHIIRVLKLDIEGTVHVYECIEDNGVPPILHKHLDMYKTYPGKKTSLSHGGAIGLYEYFCVLEPGFLDMLNLN